MPCSKVGIFGFIVRACRKSVPAFVDSGGLLVSIPVLWWNKGEWTHQFNKPKITFVTVVVEKSIFAALRHECCILGTFSNENFTIDQAMFENSRQRWFDHGQRCVPSYTYGKQDSSGVEAIDLLDDTDKRPKNKGVSLTRL